MEKIKNDYEGSEEEGVQVTILDADDHFYDFLNEIGPGIQTYRIHDGGPRI